MAARRLALTLALIGIIGLTAACADDDEEDLPEDTTTTASSPFERERDIDFPTATPVATEAPTAAPPPTDPPVVPPTETAIPTRTPPPSVTWEEALDLIRTCQVKTAAQTHARDVFLYLDDGREFVTIEPQIDLIFSEARAAEPYCGQIQIATE